MPGPVKPFEAVSMTDMEIPPRPTRENTPIEYYQTPVRVRGEPLHPVLWRGRQWAVTEYGVESLDGTYVFEAKRLANQIDVWPWTLQVTMKIWVDSDDFVTAWLVALALHGTFIPAEKVRAAVARSYTRAARPPIDERPDGWQPDESDEEVVVHNKGQN